MVMWNWNKSTTRSFHHLSISMYTYLQ
jgi:hypothetical protein